jgi:two-component system phosphate regulon response regulator PhoB
VTRILVAEDDPDIRDLAVFQLQQAGFDVVAVDNGVSALASARDDGPDLLLLDVMMPGMSGLDVCRELRGDGRTSALPVILLTGRVDDGDVEMGLGAGADDYMVKPFNPHELVGRVAAVLTRRGTLRP